MAEGPKESWPSFSVDLKDIPEARKWEVGKLYGLKVQVKQTRLEVSEQMQRVEFEIRKIAVG